MLKWSVNNQKENERFCTENDIKTQKTTKQARKYSSKWSSLKCIFKFCNIGRSKSRRIENIRRGSTVAKKNWKKFRIIYKLIYSNEKF